MTSSEPADGPIKPNLRYHYPEDPGRFSQPLTGCPIIPRTAERARPAGPLIMAVKAWRGWGGRREGLAPVWARPLSLPGD